MESMKAYYFNQEDLPQSLSEEEINSLSHSVDKKLKKISTHEDHHIVCIYRISEKYPKFNQEAYTPQIVSIGPVHHGEMKLQAMESYKLRYLRSFIDRTKMDITDLVKFAAKRESFTRACYEGIIQYSPKAFCEMILLDGVFIVELLMRNRFHHMRDAIDLIFVSKWMFYDVLHDMLLLENQLPISFVLGLFNFIEGSLVHHTSFFHLASEYFKDVGITSRLRITEDCFGSRHFVELLLYLYQPSCERQGRPLSYEKPLDTRGARELQEAGVKFKVATSSCLFDVSFCVSDGVMTIPQLKVDDFSETFFRNLIAFEQFEFGHYSRNNISSYIIFMDSLINTSNDVSLLVEKGIIDNSLGGCQQVVDLFDKLYKLVVLDQRNFYFARICGDLEKYVKNYLHEWKVMWFRWKLITWFRWKVILLHEYFNNPWSVISVVAAFILLVLTVIQTICSLKQTF